MIGYLALFLVPGYLAAYLPGLAALHYAWARRSLFLGLLGALLLAVPIILRAVLAEHWRAGLTDREVDFAYVLCFFPGLLILIHKSRRDAPFPRPWVPIVYLIALIALVSITAMLSEAYGGIVVFALVGILLAVWENLKSVVVARILGVLLMLAPLGATLAVALPRHLELNREMQTACASDPGLSITAASAPVWVVALDMASIYDGSGHVCARLNSRRPFDRYTPQHDCFTPIHEGWLTGIEVGGDGWHPHRLPPGLYLYQVRTPDEVESFGLSPRLEEQACAWRTRSEGVEHCIGFGPLEALTADYLLRRRSAVPSFDAVYSESFEIIERVSGEPVAHTTGFYATKGNRKSLLAAPLQYLLPRDKACAENGPPLLPFLEAFVRASR